MKKTMENRYPHSATLFKFCKEALQIRYQGNVKVIDQDVGAILGYDPADCSHWKKGKKNIRALNTLKSIADHLKIDESLLIDIAAGKVSLEEAVFEFKGYGDFKIAEKTLEDLKKQFFTTPEKWQVSDNQIAFDEIFKVDRAAIMAVVEKMMEKGRFEELPVYIAEVFNLFSNIKLERDDNISDSIKVIRDGEREQLRTIVKYKGEFLRPYMRFLIAKELFMFLYLSKNEILGAIRETPEEIIDIHGNIFATYLLVPNHLLKREVRKVRNSLDIVQHFADIFWVSKSFMNQRLREFMAES